MTNTHTHTHTFSIPVLSQSYPADRRCTPPDTGALWTASLSDAEAATWSGVLVPAGSCQGKCSFSLWSERGQTQGGSFQSIAGQHRPHCDCDLRNQSRNKDNIEVRRIVLIYIYKTVASACLYATYRPHAFPGAALRDRLKAHSKKPCEGAERLRDFRLFCFVPNPPPTCTDETAHAVTFFLSSFQPPPTNVQQAVSRIVFFNEPVYAVKSKGCCVPPKHPPWRAL